MEPVNKVTTVESLRIALQQLGLNTKGHKPELKQRYRKALKKQIKEENNDKEQEIEVEVETNRSKQPFDYYLFFDVEATCEDKCGFSYPNEIIEFPVILVKSDSFEIVNEYRSYVKPTINSTLSDFCTKLTGITQSTVDQSPTFVEVLNDFQLFLAKYELFQQSSAAFVTVDGPFDIRDFITKQCLHSRIKRPAYFDIPWVNLRKTFKDFYHLKENKNINGMLTHLKMEFKGREHSGLDDARNLALIAQRMNQEGCVLETNCRFDKKLHQPYQKYRKRYVK
ncbi:3'-5' exonuclease eri1 [Choanephora cucurbitarum]|uniref:3'-5' exonuclease eri1 n=1 Tax=Choanephora cucurbitarum TaxID=101091 RepID=A0A1C7NBF1_9FUNG|nr:3'-5' exonuclease eri1 [Choanephora cucurbitarum]